MDYRIGICDDEEEAVRYLSACVKEWGEAAGLGVSVESFSSAEAFLFQYGERKDYDILLLDIEMGKMDGVSMAKTLRAGNDWVQIIFVTGYSDYIAEGYEVSALHYLMKPVSREKLFEVLNRAVGKLKKNERYLTLELSGETVRVPFYEIRYLDVRQNYVTIHGREDYTVKRPLAEFERQLDDRFFRAGRSCILNLTCIQKVLKTQVYLSDGTVLPLPRGIYNALNQAMIARL